MYYPNVHGLRTKLCDLRCVSSIFENYNIILLLVEMWLNDSKINAELGFKNYKNYKTFQLFDKNSVNNDLLHGGGVLIAVRNCLL